MSVEEVAERLTIRFPRAVVQEEFEQLLYFVANYQNLGEVSYVVEQRKNVGPARLAPAQTTAASKQSVKYEGSIYQHSKSEEPEGRLPFASAHFESQHNRDPLRVEGIKFNTIPGWEIAEYDANEIKLMDTVRERVNMYFSAIDNGASLEDALER